MNPVELMRSLLLESRIENAHRQNVWATRVDSFCNQNFNHDFVKGNIRRFSTIRVNQVKQSPVAQAKAKGFII